MTDRCCWGILLPGRLELGGGLPLDETILFNANARGRLAETMVADELRRRGLVVIHLPPGFGYDLYANNGACIEVKSSLAYPPLDPCYKFHNTTYSSIYFGGRMFRKDRRAVDRRCDFYVLVGFRDTATYDYYIVPKAEMRDPKRGGDRGTIGFRVYPSPKKYATRVSPFLRFKDAWGLLVEFGGT